MTFDDQFAARENVDCFFHLGEKIKVLGFDLRRATIEIESDESHDDIVSLAENTCLIRRKHLLDLLELLLDACLGFETLNEGRTFFRSAAKTLIERPHFLFHVGNTNSAFGALLLQ